MADDFFKNHAQYVPTTFELAQIAAILSQGRKMNPEQSAFVTAREAYNLWEECNQFRLDQVQFLLLKELERAEEKLRPKIQVPKISEYPVSLDDFLKLAFPQKRLEDRMKIYREFKRFELQYQGQYLATGEAIPFEKVPVPSDEEVAQVIEERQKIGYSTEHHFNRAFRALKRFSESYSAELRQKRAKLGAAARKKKKTNG